MQRAFSLVELSIVLVILGLLTGGILAGQSLIRAAEMRAVATEHSRYITAIQAFRDKYFSIPGDFRDATRFWSRMTNTGDCPTNSGASVNASGSCDGNGDGQTWNAPAINQSGEIFQFWRHLAAAGLIEGTYSGLAGSNAGVPGFHTVPGTNSPRSRLNNAGWGVQTIGTTGNAIIYTADYGNSLIFGGEVPGSVNFNAALKPEEAWNIDTKIDDGKPGRGRVIAAHWDNAGTPSCATSTSNTDYTGEYKLTNSGIACSFYFPRVY